MSAHEDQDEARADATEDRAAAARIYAELSKAQRDFLWWAAYWTGRDGCLGCGAEGARHRAAAALEARGLVRDEGLCVNVDDHSLPERVTYSITTLGRAVNAIGEEGKGGAR